MNKKLLVGIVVAGVVLLAMQIMLVLILVKKGDKQPPVSYIEDAKCGLNMKMVYVDGGSYNFGRSNCGHEVTLSGFWIGECEVTQAQWRAIMRSSVEEQSKKSHWQTGEDRPIRGKGSNYPMYYVSYDEAKAFCQRLSELTGRKYDLPTEAQWEFAARGGSKGCMINNYEYSGSGILDEVAWYDGNSNKSAHPVKTLAPNELGIYDMSGNLREWCRDWYSEGAYSGKKNPKGPKYGTERVVRGGSWRWGAKECSVWHRNFNRREIEQRPEYSTSYVGFRVVCIR